MLSASDSPASQHRSSRKSNIIIIVGVVGIALCAISIVAITLMVPKEIGTPGGNLQIRTIQMR